MNDSIYLVLNKKGVVKMSKRPPRLMGDERSVCIEVCVDDSVFEYSFMKTVLKIGEEDVEEPELKVQVRHAVDKL